MPGIIPAVSTVDTSMPYPYSLQKRIAISGSVPAIFPSATKETGTFVPLVANRSVPFSAVRPFISADTEAEDGSFQNA